MNSLITTLAVVLLPGFLWARFDARYTRQAKPSETVILLNSLVFATISYFIAGLIYAALRYVWPDLRFDVLGITGRDTEGAIFNPLLIDEILVATAVALTLALLNLYSETNKVPWRILKRIGATRRYGDEDVWDFVLTADRSEFSYVNVRDLDNGLIFTGYIQTFSETGPIREILLSEAVVYNEKTGAELYDVPTLYLCRAADRVTLEFPATEGDMKVEQHPQQ